MIVEPIERTRTIARRGENRVLLDPINCAATELIRRLRRRQQLSRSDVALIFGCLPSAIASLEAGTRELRVCEVLQLAALLNVDVNAMLRQLLQHAHLRPGGLRGKRRPRFSARTERQDDGTLADPINAGVANVFRRLRERSGLSMGRFCALLGLSDERERAIERRRSEIDVLDLLLLAAVSTQSVKALLREILAGLRSTG